MADQNAKISASPDQQTIGVSSNDDISMKTENDKSATNQKSCLPVDKNDRCAHFVQRKKRTCRMMIKPGKKYCGEHANLEEEVPFKTGN